MSNTPLRSVRIPDDVWEAAKAVATQRGETVTAAIVRFLRGYSRGEGRSLENMNDTQPQSVRIPDAFVEAAKDMARQREQEVTAAFSWFLRGYSRED